MGLGHSSGPTALGEPGPRAWQRPAGRPERRLGPCCVRPGTGALPDWEPRDRARGVGVHVGPETQVRDRQKATGGALAAGSHRAPSPGAFRARKLGVPCHTFIRLAISQGPPLRHPAPCRRQAGAGRGCHRPGPDARAAWHPMQRPPRTHPAHPASPPPAQAAGSTARRSFRRGRLFQAMETEEQAERTWHPLEGCQEGTGRAADRMGTATWWHLVQP